MTFFDIAYPVVGSVRFSRSGNKLVSRRHLLRAGSCGGKSSQASDYAKGASLPADPEPLFTGMFTFPSPQEPDKKQFGMVGCTADPDGNSGVAIIFLRLRESGITSETIGSSLKITIPEAEVKALLPIVEKAVKRLESLRAELSSDPPQG
jgi:hypothetical protein